MASDAPRACCEPPEKKQKFHDSNEKNQKLDESDDDESNDNGTFQFVDDPDIARMILGDWDSDCERNYKRSNYNPTQMIPEVPNKSVKDSEKGEYDSDDEDMINELMCKYHEQVLASDGFEVEEFLLLTSHMYGMVMPIPSLHKNTSLLKKLDKLSNFAIQKYNNDNHAKYDFVNIVKANCQPVVGFLYYITFEAKNADGGQLETFQAKVLRGIKENKVEMCRPKPLTS